MVRFTADAATAQASSTIASYIDTQSGSKGVPVLVFNPLAWQRTGLVDFTVQLPAAASAIEVVDGAGKALEAESSLTNSATHTFTVRALVPDVPSLGYELVYVRPAGGAKAQQPRVCRSAPTNTRWKTSSCAWWSIPKPAASPAW